MFLKMTVVALPPRAAVVLPEPDTAPAPLTTRLSASARMPMLSQASALVLSPRRETASLANSLWT